MNNQQFLDWLDKRNRSGYTATLRKPLIMGVVNVTEDSFFDGGKFLSSDNACAHALALVEQGADLIDIGGESTKPGVAPVSLEIELSRVIPVIEKIRFYSDVCISIDTYKPEVMQAAIAAGANSINDICALQMDGALEMAAQLDVPVYLMHMQGTPQNMQRQPSYPHGVVAEIKSFFIERIQACEGVGIKTNQIILDPGFGFGKLVNHNLQIMGQLDKLKIDNLPLLLGVSRKSTIGAILDKDVDQRLTGSIALSVYAALKGVDVLRTHDVGETNQALKMIEAIGNCHLS